MKFSFLFIITLKDITVLTVLGQLVFIATAVYINIKFRYCKGKRISVIVLYITITLKIFRIFYIRKILIEDSIISIE